MENPNDSHKIAKRTLDEHLQDPLKLREDNPEKYDAHLARLRSEETYLYTKVQIYNGEIRTLEVLNEYLDQQAQAGLINDEQREELIEYWAN